LLAVRDQVEVLFLPEAVNAPADDEDPAKVNGVPPPLVVNVPETTPAGLIVPEKLMGVSQCLVLAEKPLPDTVTCVDDVQLFKVPNPVNVFECHTIAHTPSRLTAGGAGKATFVAVSDHDPVLFALTPKECSLMSSRPPEVGCQEHREVRRGDAGGRHEDHRP
jgi:hypothetical protein